MRFLVSLVVTSFAVIVFVGFISAQKFTPEQILAKHLAAIGSPAKLQSLKTLFAAGRSDFEARNPLVRGGGKVVVISDSENLYFLMSLNSKEYPFEKIGMFRDKISLPFVTSGSRSTLGAFLSEHSRILSDSLFCGSMSHRWITNVATNSKLKLASAGQKKINGQQTYVVEVLMGASTGDFKVRLFFDAETFHHVRTEYNRTVPVRQPTFGRQNELADARIDVTEEFSDFKDVDGLMLPHEYKVSLVSNSLSQTFSNSWGIKVINYYLNQKLTDDFFTFDVK
jgi:hypothetical protein